MSISEPILLCGSGNHDIDKCLSSSLRLSSLPSWTLRIESWTSCRQWRNPKMRGMISLFLRALKSPHQQQKGQINRLHPWWSAPKAGPRGTGFFLMILGRFFKPRGEPATVQCTYVVTGRTSWRPASTSTSTKTMITWERSNTTGGTPSKVSEARRRNFEPFCNFHPFLSLPLKRWIFNSEINLQK